MITFILCIGAFYISNLALSFVLWTAHSMAWFHCHMPGMTETEADATLHHDRVNRVLRRWHFGLLMPLIHLYEAHHCTQALLRITLLQRSGYPVSMHDGKVLVDLRKKVGE